MKRSKAILLFALAGIVMALSLVNSDEPRHAGRGLSHWVREFHSSRSGEAREALRAIGTNAIPLLLAELDASPSSLLIQAKPILNSVRPGFVHKRYQNVWDRRDAAAFAFLALGDHGASAVPQLIALLSNNMRAALALACIGPAAVPELAEAVKSPSLPIQMAAIRALGGMRHKAALPPLFEAVHYPNPGVRRAAILALSQEEALAPEVVPVLLQCTRDHDPAVQSRAIYALGLLGPAASNALPRLRELASSPDQFNNAEARRSVAQIVGAKDQQP